MFTHILVVHIHLIKHKILFPYSLSCVTYSSSLFLYIYSPFLFLSSYISSCLFSISCSLHPCPTILSPLRVLSLFDPYINSISYSIICSINLCLYSLSILVDNCVAGTSPSVQPSFPSYKTEFGTHSIAVLKRTLGHPTLQGQ